MRLIADRLLARLLPRVCRALGLYAHWHIGRMRFLQWLIGILLFVVSCVTAWLTYLAAVAADDDPSLPRLRFLLLVGALTAVILAVAQKAVDGGALRSRRKEVEALRTQFFQVFDGPLVRLMGQIEAMALLPPNARPERLHAIRHNIVRSASQLVASETSRASYFVVEAPLAPLRVAKSGEYNYSDARVDNATTTFVEAAGTAREVWTVLDTGKPAVYPDLTKRAPADWDLDDKQYRGFLTYAVHVGRTGVGVLTVNTLVKGELGGADQSIVGALAGLLSVAETLALGPKDRNTLSTAARGAGVGGAN
jgi:hypothetical protein